MDIVHIQLGLDNRLIKTPIDFTSVGNKNYQTTTKTKKKTKTFKQLMREELASNRGDLEIKTLQTKTIINSTGGGQCKKGNLDRI